MESVYLETMFISYLVARPSRDLLVAAHQQTTLVWWANPRSEFENCVSQIVIDEASPVRAAFQKPRSPWLENAAQGVAIGVTG
jgi:hypothetical protein